MPLNTFNDGDKLSVVRLNSLNPTIEKVNEIEKTIESYQKFDRGVVPGGTTSLTGLDSGWWFVPAISSVTSKPPGVIGSFIFYKQVVTGDKDSPRNGVIIAYGKSQVAGKEFPTTWVRYKTNGTGWTPWFASNRAISDIHNELEETKKTILDMSQIEQGLIDAGWTKGKPVVPVAKVIPTIHARFSNNFPTSLANMAQSKTGEVTISRSETALERIMVLVDRADATKVGTIAVNDGLPSNWLSRNLRVEGKDYTAFYSSGAYSETTAKIKVTFN